MRLLTVIFLASCNAASVHTTLEDPCEPSIWYMDHDGDGFGGGDPIAACEALPGAVEDGSDCDDTLDAVHPGAPERCNGIDDDCNRIIDDVVDRDELMLAYLDRDGDGFGGEAVWVCELDDSTVHVQGDCDDYNRDVHPDAAEVCNGLDDDCDSVIDTDAVDRTVWYLDEDGDGYGVDDPTWESCAQPDGYADNADDCDDDDAARWQDCVPAAPVGTGTCTGRLDTWVSGTRHEGEELHILGVYEADGGHGGPAGTIDVSIERETEMTLVLASYEPVNWNIATAEGTKLNIVLVSGYHEQTVAVSGSVPVEIRTYETTRSKFGAFYAYKWAEAGALVASTESHSGLSVDSFTGCYHGTEFTLR